MMKMPDIFVVDDQLISVETLQAILQQKQYRVRAETDSRKALAAIIEEPPDLVLTDIMMPHMNGYELCQALQENPKTADVPVIFLSALGNPRDRVKGLDVGGVDYIAKPYYMKEVLTRVGIHLRLYQQKREIETLHNRDQSRIETLRAEIVRRHAAESDLAQALERISRLNRLLSATNSLAELREVMGIICRELSRAYDGVTVSLTVFHQGEVLVAHHAGGDESVAFRTLPMVDRDNSQIMRDALTQHVLYFRSPVPQAVANELAELTGRQPEGDQLLIPLMFSGNLLGMAAVNPHASQTSGLLMSSAAEIAGVISQTVTNCLLFTEVTLQNYELEHRVEESSDQLERLNTRMASILASVTDAIVLLRGDGTIAMTNRGFDQLFGYAPDERFGQHISSLFAPESQQDVVDLFEGVCDGERGESLEIVGLRSDGTMVDVDMSMRRIQSGANDENHIVCSCHDISSLKETQRMKDNFVSMVTHELRTPLTGISLIAHTLVTHFERMTDEQRYDRLVNLKEQARVMADIVESVLDISRLEARKQPERVPVDFVAVGRAVVAGHEELAKQKSLALVFDGPDEAIMLAGNDEEVRRIWRNLVSNAIKYTQAGGEVYVRASLLTVDAETAVDVFPEAQAGGYVVPGLAALKPGRYVLGQVRDNGHGMSEADQEGLFTRFYRGWAKRSSIPGTGLGLAMVQELLAAYDGGIDVQSELEVGTTFTFWLPIRGLEHSGPTKIRDEASEEAV